MVAVPSVEKALVRSMTPAVNVLPELTAVLVKKASVPGADWEARTPAATRVNSRFRTADARLTCLNNCFMDPTSLPRVFYLAPKYKNRPRLRWSVSPLAPLGPLGDHLSLPVEGQALVVRHHWV